jgi:spore coat polysaccharide biosynthesis protein SpsF (cytidylyltransferase family)
VVVQARMGSRRLPGKSLRPLAGRPLIAHVLARAAAVTGVHGVVLATTAAAADLALAQAARALGACVVRGSEADVLRRVLVAAQEMAAQRVVRVTGDCPFLAPEVAAAVLGLQERAGGYAWNDTSCSGFPDGTDVEVFPMQLLAEADRWAWLPQDREHVTTWMRRQAAPSTLRSALDYSCLKLSVDTADDYALAQRVAARLPPGELGLAATLRAAELAGVWT